MANDNTFDPSQNIGRQEDRELGNLAVSSPFEPGSVNKIVTAASVIEFGLTNPDEVLSVPGLHPDGRRHRRRRLEPRRDAVHHHRGLREVLQRRHADAGAAGRPGPLRRHAAQVRAGSAHRRGSARRERRHRAADRPVVGQHVLQPAHRPRSFDDAAADGRHVPDDRQRRGADPAADRQGDRRAPTAPAPTSPDPRVCGWCRRRPRRPCAACCGPSSSATRWATSRAPGRRPPSRATRSPARPAPPSRSTRPAAATSSDVYWITFAGMAHRRQPALRRRHHDGRPAARRRRHAGTARRRRCSTTSPPGCCSARTCRCRPIPARR